MNKRMKIMLISLAILFGCIALYKLFIYFMIKKAVANQSQQVTTVSTMKVDYASWQPTLSASASLRAINGVNVTTELAGMVQAIYFKPGSAVTAGTVLVQLNAASDIAALHSLEANAALANTTYLRDKAQYAVHAVSKQTLDNDAANLKSLNAQVAQQAATVAKKTIHAPFTGRLGINNVNLGQFVNPGDKIVSLQTLNPIYADFFMPQQALAQLQVGQSVTVTSDTYPGKKFTGKITTIDPAVDKTTRNVEVEATITNPNFELTPGMFAAVVIDAGKPQRYLTLPQTAVSFNSYGQIVYIVNSNLQQKQKVSAIKTITNFYKSAFCKMIKRWHTKMCESSVAETPAILTVKQSFVTTGEARGDQVTILQGLKAGDTVVTSGQLKLKNDSQIAVNNSIVPEDSPTPDAPDEY